MFRSLAFFNYRVFIITRGLSLIGSLIQNMVLLWLVYELTGSALYVGLAALADQGASFLLCLFAGVLADRLPRRKMILWVQSLAMIVTLGLIAAFYLNMLSLSVIVIARLFVGITEGIEMPIRHAFVYDLVDKSCLPNAIALHSSMYNTSKIIGPALGGFLIPVAGAGFCFILNGVSFLAFIFGLLLIKGIREPVMRMESLNFYKEIKEGIQYSINNPPIRLTLLLVISCSLFGFSYTVLLPAFAMKVFQGGSENFGFMQTATAIGALSGTFLLAAKRTVSGIDRPMILGAIGYGAAIILFSCSHSLWISFILLGCVGISQVFVFSNSNTLIQLVAEESMRGRVSSLYIGIFYACVAVGGLILGWAADKAGLTTALMVSGFICMIISVIIAARLRSIRAHYEPGLVQLDASVV